VPPTNPFGVLTTPATLATIAERAPDRDFLVAGDGELSFWRTAILSAKFASGLQALGLQRGDRIGILLPNGIRWCLALFAAHCAGLCVVPLNTWYRVDELGGVARRAKLRAVITQADVFGFAAADAIDTLHIPGYLGTLRWPPDAQLPVDLPEVTGPPDALAALRDSPVDASSDALVLFTSGSTAAPKAVRLSHAGMVGNAYAVGERQGVRAGDKFWFASPLFFVFGCANALPNALTHAATLCLQERFDAEEALQFIERQRCTVYYGVGPMTRALAASPSLGLRDISSLRTGTANATPEDLRIAIEVLGVAEVCNAYGMTEGYGHSTITAHDDPADVRINTQGRALPTQEVRVVVDGVVAGAGVPGDVQIRGTISSGYLDGNELNVDVDGWFTTGDLGSVDQHGNLRYLGRKDEVMKVKGVNISPLEIELLLIEHELVEQAYVFGLATADGDQTVGCALVSSVAPNERDELGRDVRTWVRERAASYKVPRTVRILDAGDLPLTATGKVSKRLLAEQMQEVRDPSEPGTATVSSATEVSGVATTLPHR
jgi:acyl-CoA synthetase (AMP-forming)/AMP-acid ligase II